MAKLNVQQRRANGKKSRNRERNVRRRQPPSDLTIQRVGQVSLRLSQEDFVDERLVARLKRQFEASSDTSRFRIHDLLGWDDASRWSLFTLIAGLKGNIEIRYRHDDRTFDCLFEAVLHVIEGDSNMERFERSRRAAIEAVSLVHADRIDAACRQVHQRFRELGVRNLRHQSLVRQTQAVAGQAQGGIPLDPLAAARAFRDHLARQASLQNGQPALRYYQDAFFEWSGKVWRSLDDRQFHAQVVRFLQGNGGVEKLTERFARDVIANLKGMTLLPTWKASMPLWVGNEEPPNVARSHYVVFQNGMLNLAKVIEGRRMKLRDFHPANFNQVVLPYEYDRRASCPLWEDTLADIFPSLGKGDRRIRLLQEFMGWTLVCSDTSFAKFMILVGKGGNGKSTILQVWQELLGRDNVSHVPLERFSGEFRLHEMMGKLANISGDMNRVEKVEEGLLKELTSGDAIQVNRKFKSPMTMTPTARLIFAANVLPPINDKSDGMWRRIIAMPFHVSFEGSKTKDRQRAQRLLRELPGIFNWAVEGARRLYDRNRFTRCEVCHKCADDHRFHSDPFRQFLSDECILGAGQVVEPQALYSAFRSWCERNGRKAFASSEFCGRLEDFSGVSRRRPGSGNSRQRLWSGIGLQAGVRRPI